MSRNRPRSIYQYSNMAPRLSGQTSIFGVVFTQKTKKDGNRGTPEVLNEVKVNQNLVLISKTLLFILESLHPLGITHCIS